LKELKTPINYLVGAIARSEPSTSLQGVLPSGQECSRQNATNSKATRNEIHLLKRAGLLIKVVQPAERFIGEWL
jgi:hypothetical protein